MVQGAALIALTAVEEQQLSQIEQELKSKRGQQPLSVDGQRTQVNPRSLHPGHSEPAMQPLQEQQSRIVGGRRNQLRGMPQRQQSRNVYPQMTPQLLLSSQRQQVLNPPVSERQALQAQGKLKELRTLFREQGDRMSEEDAALAEHCRTVLIQYRDQAYNVGFRASALVPPPGPRMLRPQQNEQMRKRSSPGYFDEESGTQDGPQKKQKPSTPQYTVRQPSTPCRERSSSIVGSSPPENSEVRTYGPNGLNITNCGIALNKALRLKDGKSSGDPRSDERFRTADFSGVQ